MNRRHFFRALVASAVAASGSSALARAFLTPVAVPSREAVIGAIWNSGPFHPPNQMCQVVKLICPVQLTTVWGRERPAFEGGTIVYTDEEQRRAGDALWPEKSTNAHDAMYDDIRRACERGWWEEVCAGRVTRIPFTALFPGAPSEAAVRRLKHL